MSFILDIVRDIVSGNSNEDGNAGEPDKCVCQCNFPTNFYTICIVSISVLIILFLVLLNGIITERNVALTTDCQGAYDTIALQEDQIAELTFRLDRLRKGVTSPPHFDEDMVDSLEHETCSRCAFWNSEGQ